MPNDPNREFESFVSTTSRLDRYQFANKTLRLFIYQWMERYVALSFLASLALPWLDSGPARDMIFFNTWIVAIVGIAHHLKLALFEPWIVMAVATEAGVLWVVYHWVISSFFLIPYFGVFCVFLFVARYWLRGERRVNVKAFLAVDASRKLTSKPV